MQLEGFEMLCHQGIVRNLNLSVREETCCGVERIKWVICCGRRDSGRGGLNSIQLVDLQFVRGFGLE